MAPGYNIARRNSYSSSECSDGSDHSRSTAPTVYSVRPAPKHYHTAQPIIHYYHQRDESSYSHSSRRSSVSSVATYASTTPSEVDFVDEEYALYDEPESFSQSYYPAALPSTSSEFAQLFPSTRKLNICHDNTTDGNMNLRIDTQAEVLDGGKVELTLFHLRMHDLKNREFSLRRYGRDSGREVCHSSRKYTKPTLDRRPGFQRSMSNALASLRHKSDSRSSTKTSLKRIDSGYDSMSDQDDKKPNTDSFSAVPKSSTLPLPTNTTKLTFSNYAHVDLKRRGAKSAKRYSFQYWGSTYAWKRVVKNNGTSKETSFHLYNNCSGASIAHIVPNKLSPTEAGEEQAKGGWVPPCTMWISDTDIYNAPNDIADVIVATGITALVDECIKSTWHRKDRFHFSIPSMANLQHIGPKRLIDEMFHRPANMATGRSISQPPFVMHAGIRA